MYHRLNHQTQEENKRSSYKENENTSTCKAASTDALDTNIVNNGINSQLQGVQQSLPKMKPDGNKHFTNNTSENWNGNIWMEKCFTDKN